MKIEIELTDIETKALSYVMSDPKEWTENAIKERARVAIDELVIRETERMMNDPSVKQMPASVEDIVMNAE